MSSTHSESRRGGACGAGFFDSDFDGLRVGESYRGPARRLSPSEVAVFADLTGDDHPLHLDPDFAAKTAFGGVIAHGLLVVSCAVGSLPLAPERVVALRRIDELVFKRPLGVGQTFSSQCEITSLRPINPTSGLVGCRVRALGPEGKLLFAARVEILWKRQPGGAGSPRPAQVAVKADELSPVQVDGGQTRVLI